MICKLNWIPQPPAPISGAHKQLILKLAVLRSEMESVDLAILRFALSEGLSFEDAIALTKGELL